MQEHNQLTQACLDVELPVRISLSPGADDEVINDVTPSLLPVLAVLIFLGA